MKSLGIVTLAIPTVLGHCKILPRSGKERMKKNEVWY